MSGNQMAFPPTIADVPASAAKSGYMQRWHAGDATHGPLAVTAKGMAGRLYVPPATASLAGALSAADFNKLGSLRVPGLRLNTAAGADLIAGAALTANTYADVWANQNFTATATAVYLIFVRFGVLVTAVAGAGSMATRAVINSAGTPVNVKLSAASFPAGGQASAGTASFALVAGLPAGTNTIKLQVVSGVNAQGYCRAGTVPTTEFAEIAVLEVSV